MELHGPKPLNQDETYVVEKNVSHLVAEYTRNLLSGLQNHGKSHRVFPTILKLIAECPSVGNKLWSDGRPTFLLQTPFLIECFFRIHRNRFQISKIRKRENPAASPVFPWGLSFQSIRIYLSESEYFIGVYLLVIRSNVRGTPTFRLFAMFVGSRRCRLIVPSRKLRDRAYRGNLTHINFRSRMDL